MKIQRGSGLRGFERRADWLMISKRVGVNADNSGESVSQTVTQKAPAIAGAVGFYPVRPIYCTWIRWLPALDFLGRASVRTPFS